ncbi:MAG: hypothetical protein AAGF12_30280 [Myxococcota bacterium]
MLIVFEVHHMPSVEPKDLLSEEVRNETMAQIMSVEEAAAVGFQAANLEAAPNRAVCLIAVAQKDARFIQSRLEASQAVTSFRGHEVAN